MSTKNTKIEIIKIQNIERINLRYKMIINIENIIKRINTEMSTMIEAVTILGGVSPQIIR